jgi:serine/threonine-protein kinase haspin
VKTIPKQANALRSVTTNQTAKPKRTRVSMDDISNGVITTVIDLGLSRMDAGDGGDGERVHWTPFDEEIFQGEGNLTNQINYMSQSKTLFLQVITSSIFIE